MGIWVAKKIVALAGISGHGEKWRYSSNLWGAGSSILVTRDWIWVDRPRQWLQWLKKHLKVSVVLVECTRISYLAPEAESLSEMDLLSFS